jgi:hypothetical protein
MDHSRVPVLEARQEFLPDPADPSLQTLRVVAE